MASLEPKALHSKYFLDDVPVIFKVEGVLFKVHKHFLARGSPVFQTMFACPRSPEGTSEGLTEDNPILLPEVTAEEFQTLLDFYYDDPQNIGDATPSSWFDEEKFGDHDEKFLSLLAISTKFDFQVPRTIAIEALGKYVKLYSPIKAFLLSRKYEVDEWFRPAYVELCMREDPLTIEEGNQLGVEATVKLAKARETFLAGKWQRGRNRSDSRGRWVSYARPVGRSPSPSPDPSYTRADRIIGDIFFPDASESQAPSDPKREIRR